MRMSLAVAHAMENWTSNSVNYCKTLIHTAKQKENKHRQQQDLNLRGHSPPDFKSGALTTRPCCLMRIWDCSRYQKGPTGTWTRVVRFRVSSANQLHHGTKNYLHNLASQYVTSTGLEPATPRFEVWCAIHCATRSHQLLSSSETVDWYYYISSQQQAHDYHSLCLVVEWPSGLRRQV